MRALLCTALLMPSLLPAEEVLPLFDRTNGVRRDDQLSPLRPALQSCLVRVLDRTGQHVVTGTFVSADGFFLTKASEAPESQTLSICLPDGSKRTARVVQRALDRDLLLARADVSSAEPALWAADAPADWGQWVVAASSGLNEDGEWAAIMRLGVISAARRSIPASKAALGLEVEDLPAAAGNQVAAVWPDSPAARAGVREGDQVLAVDEQEVSGAREMRESLQGKRAGQTVRLTLSRKQAEVQVSLRLGSYSRVSLTAAGEDYANGGVSLRTDGYAAVLQHDLPLKPRDMGSPLVDLTGRCIGLNISRVDRVSTFALPVDSFWPVVQQWIEADRRQQPEVIRRALPLAEASGAQE
jgi:serine protease Do